MARVPGRSIEMKIAPGLRAEADPGLLRIVLENLIGNAVKYTGRQAAPRVEIGCFVVGSEEIFYVKDNGAGFEPAHATKLFQPFARLHTQEEFPGTGIGLTTVRRVITRHGGRIWAEAAPDTGATFFFTVRPASLGGSAHQ
jgi:light-regulated signal transduction histidine kinase (bacteriophytochrome)